MVLPTVFVGTLSMSVCGSRVAPEELLVVSAEGLDVMMDVLVVAETVVGLLLLLPLRLLLLALEVVVGLLLLLPSACTMELKTRELLLLSLALVVVVVLLSLLLLASTTEVRTSESSEGCLSVSGLQ